MLICTCDREILEKVCGDPILKAIIVIVPRILADPDRSAVSSQVAKDPANDEVFVSLPVHDGVRPSFSACLG